MYSLDNAFNELIDKIRDPDASDGGSNLRLTLVEKYQKSNVGLTLN
jgi:hypothetical protein